MNTLISLDRLRFLLNRFEEKLWVRPLAVCSMSVAVVFAASLVDDLHFATYLPAVSKDSIETLLSLLAASMLVIATFSVGAMVSAYAAASGTATPRSFTLVLADDGSQNALSTFVGAFIFSVVALTAVKNDFYQHAGLFSVFVLTVMTFAVVIVTFVRWVDNIARLGRVGSTIEKVESATRDALIRRRDKPTLGGVVAPKQAITGQPVYAAKIGYVQHIDMAALQGWAEQVDVKVVVAALPGTFVCSNQPLAYLDAASAALAESDCRCLVESFEVGSDRTYEDDPRFGLVALSEIAARALSPAVNDPGTAIKVIGSMVRLISLFGGPKPEQGKPDFDRIAVPEVSVDDMFDDAFTAIARDGAGAVEVCIRLQKALASLDSLGNDDISKAAQYHRDLALKRATIALVLDEDLTAVKEVASAAQSVIKHVQ